MKTVTTDSEKVRTKSAEGITKTEDKLAAVQAQSPQTVPYDPWGFVPALNHLAEAEKAVNAIKRGPWYTAFDHADIDCDMPSTIRELNQKLGETMLGASIYSDGTDSGYMAAHRAIASLTPPSMLPPRTESINSNPFLQMRREFKEFCNKRLIPLLKKLSKTNDPMEDIEDSIDRLEFMISANTEIWEDDIAEGRIDPALVQLAPPAPFSAPTVSSTDPFYQLHVCTESLRLRLCLPPKLRRSSWFSRLLATHPTNGRLWKASWPNTARVSPALMFWQSAAKRGNGA